MLRKIAGIWLLGLTIGVAHGQGEANSENTEVPSETRELEAGQPPGGEEGEPLATVDPVDPVEPLAPLPATLEEALAVPPLPDEGTTVYFNEDFVPGASPDLFENLAEVPSGGGGSFVGGEGGESPLGDFSISSGEMLPGGFGSVLSRQGWRFGLGTQAMYDSNIFLDGANERSDLKLTASPSFEYRSAPAGVPGQINFLYTPHFRHYVDNDDLSTIDHALNSTISYTGARTVFTATASGGRFSHADRFVGGVSESVRANGIVSLHQQIGSRSSLRFNWQGSFNRDEARQASSAILGEPERKSSVAQLSAFWQASSKTQFGPSLRYNTQTSTLSGDHRSVSFLGVIEHQPKEGLELSLSLGVERVLEARFGQDESYDGTGTFTITYDVDERVRLGADLSYASVGQGNGSTRSGGGGQRFSGDAYVVYQPNPDWRFRVVGTFDSFPSADGGNTSIENNRIQATLSRIIPSGSISLTGRLSVTDFEVSGGGLPRGDSNYHSLILRYVRELGDQGRLNTSLFWSESSGGGLDWDRIQAAIGLDWDF